MTSWQVNNYRAASIRIVTSKINLLKDSIRKVYYYAILCPKTTIALVQHIDSTEYGQLLLTSTYSMSYVNKNDV